MIVHSRRDNKLPDTGSVDERFHLATHPLVRSHEGTREHAGHMRPLGGCPVGLSIVDGRPKSTGCVADQVRELLLRRGG